LFEKGRELYGLFEARQAIREAGRVLVVEGYMDVVALAQSGIGYVVASLGTACTPMHVQKLVRQADRVIFCFDGDAAGQRAAWRALENTLPLLADNKKFQFLFLPEEHDPDTYVREHGREAFEQAEDRATPLSQYFVQGLSKDLDLSQPEDRSRLMHSAKPLVSQVTAPMMRYQMVRLLGEAVDMQPAEVEKVLGLARTVGAADGRSATGGDGANRPSGGLFPGKGRGRGNRNAHGKGDFNRFSAENPMERASSGGRPLLSAARARRVAPPTQAARLLRLLIDQPQLAHEAAMEEIRQTLDFGDALADLVSYCESVEKPFLTHNLLANWVDQHPSREVYQAARRTADDEALAPDAVAGEFAHLVQRLRESRLRQEMDALVEAQKINPSEEQKSRLRLLMQEMSGLQKHRAA
jgi:DNA primase